MEIKEYPTDNDLDRAIAQKARAILPKATERLRELAQINHQTGGATKEFRGQQAIIRRLAQLTRSSS